MKNKIIYSLCAVLVLTLSACHSSELTYKNAYNKMQEQKKQQDAPVSGAVAPVAIHQTTNSAESAIREDVNIIEGEKQLKRFNIVANSFKLKVTAEDQMDRMIDEGYKKATIVKNIQNEFFRIIIATFDEYEPALQELNKFKAKYADRKDLQNAYIMRLH